jgi:hypothetical protein
MMRAKRSPVALRDRETLYMPWSGSGAGVKGWKSSTYARCDGGLTLGGRSLMTFRGSVNIKRICATRNPNQHVSKQLRKLM